MKVIANPFSSYTKKAKDELESYYSLIEARMFPLLANDVDKETKCILCRMFENLHECKLKEDADCEFMLVNRKSNQNKRGIFIQMAVNDGDLIKLIQCPIQLTEEEKEKYKLS